MDFTIKLSWPLSSLHVNVCRCSQLDLRGCALREVSISIQRDGEPQDTPFSCRVGEIMVRQWEPLVSNVFSILYMVRDPDKSLFTFEQQKKLLRYYYYFLTATTTSAVSVFQTSADISPFNASTLTHTSNPFRPQVFTLEQQKNFSPSNSHISVHTQLTLQFTTASSADTSADTSTNPISLFTICFFQDFHFNLYIQLTSSPTPQLTCHLRSRLELTQQNF